MSVKSRARDLAAKPGELAPGQSTRAAVAKAREQGRHDELVTVLSSAVDEIRAGLQPTRNAVPVTSSEPVSVVTGLSPQKLQSSPGRLIGWSLANTSATNAALVRFRNARDVAGDIVAVTVVPAGGTSTMRVGSTGGVDFGDALTLEVVPVPGAGTAGTLEGAVYFGRVD